MLFRSLRAHPLLGRVELLLLLDLRDLLRCKINTICRQHVLGGRELRTVLGKELDLMAEAVSSSLDGHASAVQAHGEENILAIQPLEASSELALAQ